MDAAQAIAELTDISPQVRRVVASTPDGAILGSNLDDPERAERLAEGGLRLLEQADAIRDGRGLGATAQLEAATVAGSVFVVRDGGRTIVATTTPEPTVGLVFYDLKSCLRAIDDEQKDDGQKPARRAASRKKAEDAAA